MKKKIFAILMPVFLFFAVFSQNNKTFTYPLPDFVKNNQYLKSNMNKYINLLPTHNGYKLLVLKGYYKDKNSNKEKFFSKLIFLDKNNKIITEKTYNCFVWETLIDNSQTPVYGITTTYIEGNDFLNKKIDFYNIKGERIMSFQLPSPEWYLIKSKDFIVFEELFDISTDAIYVSPFKDFFNKGDIKKKNFYKFIFPQLEYSQKYLILGGKNIDAIVCYEDMAKKVSLKNGKTYWETTIPDKHLIEIKKLNPNFIGLITYKNFLLININNGDILKKINLEKLISKIKNPSLIGYKMLHANIVAFNDKKHTITLHLYMSNKKEKLNVNVELTNLFNSDGKYSILQSYLSDYCPTNKFVNGNTLYVETEKRIYTVEIKKNFLTLKTIKTELKNH